MLLVLVDRVVFQALICTKKPFGCLSRELNVVSEVLFLSRQICNLGKLSKNLKLFKFNRFSYRYA